MSFDDFRLDVRTQHAVLRDLEVIGEAVKKIPAQVLARHPTVPWRRIARFRDRLAHGYFDLDLHVVWDVVETKLPHLVSEVQEILRSIETDSTDS